MLFFINKSPELMTQIILLMTIRSLWMFSETRISKFEPELITKLKLVSVTQCISEQICLVRYNRPCVNVSALLVSTSLRRFLLKI